MQNQTSSPVYTTGHPEPYTASQKNDRILTGTRLITASFAVVSLLVFLILYGLPGNTDVLFAWTIRPDMTAMFIGAAYFSGFYIFGRATFAAKWHYVHIGYLPLTAFVTFMAIATYLHLDRFHQGHPVFMIWLFLYTVLPVVVPLVWLRNRRFDPILAETNELLIAKSAQWIAGVLGGLVLILAFIFLIWPDVMIGVWFWKLTPLTARVVGACFAFSAGILLYRLFERRWSALRFTQQSQIGWSGLILLATFRAWGDFDNTRPLVWLFLALVISLLLTSLFTYFKMENRLKSKQTASN
jgi:hypothetical protein